MTSARYFRIALITVLACTATSARPLAAQPRATRPATHTPTAEELRNKMVDDEIAAAGVKNARVIAAARAVPRHEFCASKTPLRLAYYDMALPIGEGQTISPPFIVAYMTEAIDPQPTDKVLEIGTGSGYQAAILSELVKEVYTIEIVESLGKRAAKTLKRLHYDNVQAKVGDGYLGWPEHAPFDKIIVTCSPEKVPQALSDQLKEGGRMVIPVGERYQQTLYLLKKTGGKLVSEALVPTIFVPMTGAAEEKREKKPDPTDPKIINGDFSEVIGDPPQAKGWHYQRQAEVVRDSASPDKSFIRFHNTEPGRYAQALQAFAIDGRYVRQLEVTARVCLKDVKAGPASHELPLLGVTFYDENRGTLTELGLGPWHGTSDWKTETKKIDVPLKAREAIVRIGLFGATGEASFTGVKLQGLP
jgi:protein-L-isoaspartate(D-aspartate) O-methyltransferase